MSSGDSISGGCACGRIRYDYSGELILSVNCHCRNCQRAAGAAYAAIVLAWENMFEVTKGEIRYYVREPEDGDYLRRGFCSSCGSPVAMLRPLRPKLAYILVGSLDFPELYKPSMNIFIEQAHSWDVLDESLDSFAGMPAMPDELGQ
jgi:hypothetical protein